MRFRFGVHGQADPILSDLYPSVYYGVPCSVHKLLKRVISCQASLSERLLRNALDSAQMIQY